MKSKREKVPGFDEIIFENRNKEYGAYNLRKSYLATSGLSLLGVLASVTTLIIILSFTVEKKSKAKPDLDPFSIPAPEPTLIVPKNILPPDPEISKPKVSAPVYTAPEIVDKVEPTDRGMASMGSIDSIINRPVDQVITTERVPDPVIPPDESLPHISVEEMPVFPGGNQSLLRFIAEAIRYPEDAAANGIQGRVTISFVVSSDGSVQKVTVIRGIHPSLDEEAIRVVSSLPKWKPGRQNGKEVPVIFSVPVNFKLKFN
jgi:periplasmic protein TonB